MRLNLMMEKINWKNNKYLTISISAATILFFLFSFFNEQFFLWMFSRHQNILSWLIRPLLLLPFCFFSYKKNLNGILLTVLAIFTSMFWFPAPLEVNPQVAEFLQAEMVYLTSGFDLMKILSVVLIVSFFCFLSIAFWKKSIKMGIGIACWRNFKNNLEHK